ncbi:Putative OsmC/Ohr family, K domain-like, alpha/beta, OsmC/Ohr superfamily protein [Septoria linicola]|uniref:OsmC/Ohr family, K domain-like, alpha/beta, OsmC/Ohr superfamily protein n=1 Tax=Septoria linicola TaxID=215465 RepID=A0A9Q9AHW0_9PEZI|nr:putative OsmC/Ohr family, K domain-like, alpha/beta, OsmC/Ohr superfamily protein [Septoria linicola]USW47198.1 Putative OsmC/Ohr family, K domain-like, alpha/beta, OsmC/Ohr superfamily protein [Septoria linicola]
MAALRTLQPIIRSAPRLAVRSHQQARFLNQATSPSLYAAHATVTGARNGHITAENLDLQLGTPKEMGGKGGATNPEELFAAGYGACFQSAMNAVAPSLKVKLPADSVVETTVHLIGSLKELDIGIRVDMKVKVKGIEKSEVEKVVAKTKEVCPYSRATQGNVQTNVEVIVE